MDTPSAQRHCGTHQDCPAIIKRRQSPCALPCPAQDTLCFMYLKELDHPLCNQTPYIHSQESAEEPLICFRLRYESCNCVVVLAATHRVLCGKEVAAHALVLHWPGTMFWQTELLRPKQSQNWFDLIKHNYWLAGFNVSLWLCNFEKNYYLHVNVNYRLQAS
jgi:hypothetical protein